MKKKTTKGIAIAVILLATIVSIGSRAYACSGSHRSQSRTTVADAGENDYDVRYLKFDLHMSNVVTDVSGNVSTTAAVVVPVMNTYVFELDTVFDIDSFKFNGSLLPVTSVGGFVRKVSLPVPVSMGSVFTAQVFYHGTPPSGTGFFHGVTHDVSSKGTHMVYTVSDPYVAKDWWPCKQALQDKIDSVDMWVTVPAGIKVGSNGLLQSVSSPVAGFDQYKWSTHYPIDYYLISLAIAPYADYKSYVHFTGSSDSMLLHSFFYDTATFVPAYKKYFDSMDQMIDYFSQLYGRYPFWKEKYGVCFATLGGGMEHQTMTTIGVWGTNTIAHEMGHQWFGDNVTYKTWPHVWLSEGFATYTEQLYYEHFWGKAAMASHRKTLYNSAMSAPGGRVYVDDTSSATTLFNLRLVYHKAGGVAHMLRFMAPADSLFFKVLREFQQTYTFGLATTEDLKNIASTIYGRNLDTFFDQWIYKQGYPRYSAKWNQVGGNVFLNLKQTTSMPSSVPVFSMPVEIRLKSATGDTVVRVYNDKSLQSYSFSWSQTVDSVFIDPDNWIIHKTDSVRKDPTLMVSEHELEHVTVSPNPTAGTWAVGFLPIGMELQLTDLSGRIVWRGRNEQSSVVIQGSHLPSGTYILTINPGDKDSMTVKLVHW